MPKISRKCKHKWVFLEKRTERQRGPGISFKDVTTGVFHCEKCLEVKTQDIWTEFSNKTDNL